MKSRSAIESYSNVCNHYRKLHLSYMVVSCLFPRSPENYLNCFRGLEDVSRKTRAAFPVAEDESNVVLACKAWM